MRVIQIAGASGRRVGMIEGSTVRLFEGPASVYSLAQAALQAAQPLIHHLRSLPAGEALDYAAVYSGDTEWRVLPAIDHPDEPARCLVSGTGLTHLAGAKNRDAMHAAAQQGGAAITDSMRMYQSGVEGGRPEPGKIGISPEWFYKGNGAVLRAHNEPLDVPDHAQDGGEEPEIAGVYIVDAEGAPRRIGLAVGNEFSDHVFEKTNYLYLAASKLMTCAIGPELAIGAEFGDVPGQVQIERGGVVMWQKSIRTGEAAMAHSLANIEHHHFKHAGHRRPGDVHVHYFGTGAFSFGEGIKLQDGDLMQVEFEGFGRALRNPVRIDRSGEVLRRVASI